MILDDGQRCLQLVGDIGDKITAQRLHTGKLFCHIVEIVDDHIHLVAGDAAPLTGNADAEVAVYDLLRRLQQLIERTFDHKSLIKTVEDGEDQ